MCRGTLEGARRCPCDTSAARQARRLRVKTNKTYQSRLNAGTPSPAPESVPAPAAPTMEERHAELITRTKENVAKLQEELTSSKFISDLEIRPDTDPEIIAAYERIDRYSCQIGEDVETLAVEKYGAKSDDEIKEITDRWNSERAESRPALLEASQQAYRARVAQLQPLRDKAAALWVAQGNEDFSTVHIDRKQDFYESAFPDDWAEQKRLLAIEKEADKAVHEWNIAESPVHDMLRKRNEAMKAALEESGVQFAAPESLVVAKGSQKPATQSLRDAVAFVPQSWVDGSNTKGTPLVVKQTQGRAHYSNNEAQTKIVGRTSDLGIHYVRDGIDPNEHYGADRMFVPMSADGTWTDPRNPERVLTARAADAQEGKTPYVEIGLQTQDFPPSITTGWEEKTFPEKRYNFETKQMELTGEMKSIWRKPHAFRERVEVGRISKLTVSPSYETNPMGNNVGSSVALHEFGHRVQSTNMDVRKMEHAFLMRRAGLATNEREAMTRIYKGKKEAGYKDSFANHYIGKTYSNGATEVTPMGLQMLWAGENGGFAGVKDHKVDRNMKHFMLGMLAATGQKDTKTQA